MDCLKFIISCISFGILAPFLLFETKSKLTRVIFISKRIFKIISLDLLIYTEYAKVNYRQALSKHPLSNNKKLKAA